MQVTLLKLEIPLFCKCKALTLEDSFRKGEENFSVATIRRFSLLFFNPLTSCGAVRSVDVPLNELFLEKRCTNEHEKKKKKP